MPFARSRDEHVIATVCLVWIGLSLLVGVAGWWTLLSIWLGALLALVTACLGLFVFLVGVVLMDSWCRSYGHAGGPPWERASR